MKLTISIKGKALDLNASEVTDLLQGLEFALGGGSGAKTFGCVTASCEGAGLLQRPDGAEHFNSGIAPEHRATF
jgi:hypothetical protein